MAHPAIQEVCRCVGISDIAAKVNGSTNTMNVVKGFFEALKQQKKPEDLARGRGKKIIDIQQAYFGRSTANL